MATKNIVPRGNNEGKLGTDEKRWNSIIAETASFTTFSGSITGAEFTLFSGSADSTASFGHLAGDGGGLTNLTATAEPGGSNTHVQFNDGGVTGGDSGFTYDKTTNSVTAITNITASGHISSSITSTGSFGLILGDGSQLTNLPASFTAAAISGSFTDLSSSLASRITTEEGDADFTADTISGSLGANANLIRSLTAIGISGSFTDASSSLASRITTEATNIDNLQTDSGSFSTRLTTAETELANELISGSAQIATEISGAFTDTSSSLASRATTLESNSLTDLSGDTTPQLGGNLDLNSNDITGTGNIDITGNITAQNFIVSSSVSSITYQALSGSTIFGDTQDDTHQFTGSLTITGSIVSNGLGVISSSAQLASNISGSLGSNATLIRTLTTAGISGSLGSNATLIRTLTAAGISGSLGSNATLIRTLTAAGISGSFTQASASFSTRITTEEGNVDTLQARNIDTGLGLTGGGDLTSDRTLTIDFSDSTFASGISGSFTQPSSSFSTRVTTLEAASSSFASDSGSFSTRLTTAETELGNTLISGSAQIASDISGSLGPNASVIRGLTNVSISGSFTIVSSSLASRLTTEEVNVDTLQSTMTSEQTNIDNLQTDSGSFSTRVTTLEAASSSFASDSGSFSTRVTTLEALDTDDDLNFAGDSGTGTIDLDSETLTIAGGGGMSSVASGNSVTLNLDSGILSSSAQIASDISGSLGPNASVIRGLTSVSISGSFVAPSASISTRLTTEEGNVDTLQARDLIAGSGLTGGGDLTSDRTFNVGEGTGISVSSDAIATNDSEIVHDNLSGFVANEHIDHSSVSITAGTGLTGGGTIASTRTLAIDFTDATFKSAISGSFTDVSSSLASRTTTLESNSLTDIVTDTTPQLGGDLDLNSNDITGTGNIDIAGNITAQNFIVSSSVTSVTYQSLSGSTIFGDDGDDTHTFTGEVILSGSTGLNVQHGNISGSSTSTGSFGILQTAGDTNIAGTLTLANISDVSASLAAAVAGGDNLGNHTATQDINLDGNSLTNVSALTATANISGSATSTGSFGHIMKGGVDFDTAVSSSAVLSGFGAGGGVSDIVDDTSPQLGGDLDLNSNDITGTGNIDIQGNISGSSTSTGSFGSVHTSTLFDAAGGRVATMASGQMVVRDHLSVSAGKAILLDGGSDTFISEGASNRIDFTTQNGVRAQISNTEINFPTANYKISGSSTSTGSFGLVLGDGSQLTNLPASFTAAGISGSFTDASSSIAEDIVEFKDGTVTLVSGSSSSTGSFGHIMKGGVNWDTAVSSSAADAGFGGGGSGTITALNNQTADRLVTIGSTTTELDGEANLTFDGTTLTTLGGVIDVKNGGTQSVVRFYCESSNAHYAQIQAPAHSDFDGNVTLTLPTTTGTLALVGGNGSGSFSTRVTSLETDSGSFSTRVTTLENPESTTADFGGYTFSTASAQTSWEVTHNLNSQYPNVTVYDNNDEVVIPTSIVANTISSSTITFDSPVSGKAHYSVGGNLSGSSISTGSFGAVIADGSQLTNLQRPITTHTTHFTASSTYAGHYNIVGGELTCSILDPNTANVAIGTEFEFFQTSSVGNMLFETGSTGTTLLLSKSGNVKLTGQYSAATLKKVDSDTWHLIGDLS